MVDAQRRAVVALSASFDRPDAGEAHAEMTLTGSLLFPRPATESSILFSFETDFTGRVKAGPQIETWQGRSAAAFTPAVILFIALPEAEDKIEPG
jgi:hypothetical protein